MLPDERVYYSERLAGAGCSQNDCATERIDDIDPAVVHPAPVIIYHRNIDRIGSFCNFLRLPERFVLEVEAVLADLVVVVLGYSVKPLVDEHCADYGAEGIEDPVGRKTEKRHAPCAVVENEAQRHERKPGKHRVYHHSPDIELQRLFRLGADTHHADTYQLGHLASGHGAEHLEASEQVKNELRDAVVRSYRQIHHYLDYQEDIYAATEVVIHLLLFPGFFICHGRKSSEGYLESEHEAVAEGVAMQEIHVVFLDYRELAAVLKYIIVLKAAFYPYEELSFHGSELRAET